MDIRGKNLATRLYLCAVVIICIGIADSSWSESILNTSILNPPPAAAALTIYDQPFADLTPSEQWRIRIHGLRLAPLHPTVWGTLRRERTQNRHLVPIKRYFLRASEDPNFRAQKITVHFRFKAADPRYMAKMPHQKDPVLEIGFGGNFRESVMSEPPLEDIFSVLRLSAFPRLSSGIFRRQFEKFTELAPASPGQLQVGKPYQLEMVMDEKQMRATLNGNSLAEFSGDSINQGLIAFQTSWHPVQIEKLEIVGTKIGTAQELKISGLVIKSAHAS